MTDWFGNPGFRRMYGFGDTATLRCNSLVAFIGGADARALAGALPTHRLLKPLFGAPLVVMQSDFVSATDNGDPIGEDRRYHEVTLAVPVVVSGLAAPALFPLVLFVDDVVAMTSGREFYGFPKVLADVGFERGRAQVRWTSYPRGEKRVTDVFRSTWNPEPGLLSRAMAGIADFVSSAVRATGIDDDTIDLVNAIALAPAGQIVNVRQLPDLTNTRRAELTQLTLFSPRLLDPSMGSIISDYSLELPEEPYWSLGRRFFRGERPRTIAAFEWSVTMKVSTGQELANW